YTDRDDDQHGDRLDDTQPIDDCDERQRAKKILKHIDERKLKHRADTVSACENEQRVENVRQGNTADKGDRVGGPIVRISREDEKQPVGYGGVDSTDDEEAREFPGDLFHDVDGMPTRRRNAW